MKKISLIVLSLLVLEGFKPTGDSKWSIEQRSAQLGFGINNYEMSDCQNYFKIVNGTIAATKDNFSDAELTLTASETSINTAQKKSVHLATDAVSAIGSFTSFSFISKTFIKIKDDANNYKLTGNLTINGITKPVQFDAECHLKNKPGNKKIIADFNITGIIKCCDFENNTSVVPENNRGDDVKIIAEVLFIKN